MALVQSLIILLLSITSTLSQEFLVVADAHHIVANKDVGPRVIITGLVSPIWPTLTLKPGAYLKILPTNRFWGKEKILKLEDIGSDNQMITFKQVDPKPAPKSATINFPPEVLAHRIKWLKVELCKPYTVFFDDTQNKVTINGLANPNPMIAFKKGDDIKLNGNEGVIEKVEFNELTIDRKAEEPMSVSLESLRDDIGIGKVQYKDNEGEWHRVDPIYELIEPLPTKRANEAPVPRNGYPKKSEIKHCMSPSPVILLRPKDTVSNLSASSQL